MAQGARRWSSAWDHEEAFLRFREELVGRSHDFRLDLLQHFIRYRKPGGDGRAFLASPKRKDLPSVRLLRRVVGNIERHVSDKDIPLILDCLQHHLILVCADGSPHTCRMHP